MFKNTLKIAWRNLLKYKKYSLINIFGLAISMACAVIIFLWVNDELSYDKYHVNSENIYRVVLDAEGGYTKMCGGMANELPDIYPEIRDATRFRFYGSFGAPNSELTFDAQNFKGFEIFADPSVFNVFTFPFIEGDPKTAFEDRTGIVITKSFAEKLFGEEKATGKKLQCAQGWCIVTGVIEDIPANSHLQFDWIRPFSVVEKMWGHDYVNGWDHWEFWTYLLLYEKAAIPDMNQKIAAVLKDKIPDWQYKVELQPLKHVYLRSSHIQYDIGIHGDIRYVHVFSLIGILLIMIASINYINLATARSSVRVKEVAVKKNIGSSRRQLFMQLQIEYMLLSFLGLSAAVILANLILPIMNDVTGKSLSIQLSDLYFIFPVFLAAYLAIGFLSSIYPAVVLSAFQPLHLFKQCKNVRTNLFKKSLVVLQFSISTISIICMLLIGHQVHFLRTKDLGFQKDHVVYFRLNAEKYLSIRNDLLSHPNIMSAATSEAPLDAAAITAPGIQDWDGNHSDKGIHAFTLKVGPRFLDTYQMKMKKGRFFLPDNKTDQQTSVVVNEAAIMQMGISDPLHKTIHLYNNPYQIIGIIRDFHFKPLHYKIEPMVLRLSNWADWTPIIGVRIRPKNVAATLSFIKDKFNSISPQRAFEYHFLNDALANAYHKENGIALLFRYCAALTILISSLGLLGLAITSAEQRTKEIGIRKTLGATVPGLIYNMAIDYVKWVLLANLIAWPIAYYAMSKWLQDFAYRIDLTIWPFLLAGLIALVIALLSVIWQVIRAATANPVDSIRNE